MYKLLSTKGQTFGFALGFGVVLIYLLIVMGGLDDFGNLAPDDQPTSNLFNFGLRAAMVLTVICCIAALLFGIFHLLTNLKGSLKFLIALAAILVIFFIGYSMADADMASAITPTIEEFGVSEGASKFIGGSLIVSLVLVVLAALSFVVFEILNIFK